MDDALITSLDIILSPDDDAELRRLSVTNEGTSPPGDIEVTSYAEIVLATQSTDIAHTGLLQTSSSRTEYHPACTALLAQPPPTLPPTIRPSGPPTLLPWAVTVAAVLSTKTDRMRFPRDEGRLSGRPVSILGWTSPVQYGSVPSLDPVFSLRARVRVAPGANGTPGLLGPWFAESREAILLLADKYHDPGLLRADPHPRLDPVPKSSFTIWRSHGAKPTSFNIWPTASSIATPPCGPVKRVLQQSTLNVTGLWQYGISGDYPIVLVRHR